MRSWSEDLDVHTPEDITAVAIKAGMADTEVAECLKDMKNEEIKQILKVSDNLHRFSILCFLECDTRSCG